MKILKRILKFLLWTFAILAIVLLLHPLWAGTVARWCANSIVPGMTKTEFNIKKIYVNLFSGRFEVEGCELANPTNYLTRTAFKLDRLAVRFDTLSALSDTIRIREIDIEGANAACVLEGLTALDPHLNFLDIANAKENEALAQMSKDEKEAYLKQKKEERAKQKKEKEELAKQKKQGPGKRVVIDKLSIKDCGAEIGFDGAVAPIPIPSFTLTDIGKKHDGEKSSKDSSGDEGLTIENAWYEVWEGLKKAEPALATAWSAIAKPVDWILDGAGDIGEIAGSAAKAIGKAGAAAAEAVGGITTDALSAGGDAAKKAGKAIGGALDKINPF